MSERKRWEAEKARQAPPENDDIIEEPIEDTPLPTLFNNAPHSNPDVTEADYLAAQEEYELQQLIASIEQESETPSQHYGSDDEDYDSIFMACAMTEDVQLQHQSYVSQAPCPHEDQMDTDMMDC